MLMCFHKNGDNTYPPRICVSSFADISALVFLRTTMDLSCWSGEVRVGPTPSGKSGFWAVHTIRLQLCWADRSGSVLTHRAHSEPGESATVGCLGGRAVSAVFGS
ncbi:hypothetical protein GDO81_028389 [Engystomops pustulosus]|uniref:Uncharacterized protein n=1 Tax=Engystomops pustulosus TaxID=76066 RepID=A0AAV6ZVN8_ENGPU|nr:hypothetical protein GDO81_028389 [Engystomops pustulosus]